MLIKDLVERSSSSRVCELELDWEAIETNSSSTFWIRKLFTTLNVERMIESLSRVLFLTTSDDDIEFACVFARKIARFERAKLELNSKNLAIDCDEMNEEMIELLIETNEDCLIQLLIAHVIMKS